EGLARLLGNARPGVQYTHCLHPFGGTRNFDNSSIGAMHNASGNAIFGCRRSHKIERPLFGGSVTQMRSNRLVDRVLTLRPALGAGFAQEIVSIKCKRGVTAML